MEFEKVLQMRRSTRRYTSEQISTEAVKALMIAARTAPLAKGDEKTTHVTIVRDPEFMEQIRACVRSVSGKTGKEMDPLYGAGTLILLSAADLSDDHIEYANVACVIENMMLQATSMELGSTYIWGCLRKLRADKEIIERLCLPEGYEILSGMVVGYPQKPLTEREHDNGLSVDVL
jgi:Nitroreductase